MTDFERSIPLDTDPDAAFELLSDVRNLPRYFEGMTSAEPAGSGNAVHVTANVEGTTREGEAWFEADAAQRTIRWGSEGPNDYHGELSIAPANDRNGGSGAANRASGRAGDEPLEITVRLHTTRTAKQGEIDDGLDRTLQRLRDLLEHDADDRADVGGA